MKFLFYFLLFERGKSDQPRIEVQNGDLKFTVAPSKNIFFQTDSGKIFLNGDDFSESLSSLNSKVDDTSKNVDQILGLGSKNQNGKKSFIFFLWETQFLRLFSQNKMRRW